jgi:hypothetical protein
MINLNELGIKWLELKKQRMQNLLKIALPDEALYREIMLSLGYPKNRTNFLELALITPYSEIRKLKKREIIEKALLYRAGFIEDKESLPKDFDFSLRMNKSVWVYKGIRLVNFFIERIKSELNELSLKLALKRIMNFEGIGIQRKEEMFFNIIMPFLMIYSEDNDLQKFLKFMFENYPPLSDNRLIKSFKHCHPDVKIINLKTYMGALMFQKSSGQKP